MFDPENTEAKQDTDPTEEQLLVLDGTVNLDYSDDEPIPRIKGLIELWNHYLRNKSGQNP